MRIDPSRQTEVKSGSTWILMLGRAARDASALSIEQSDRAVARSSAKRQPVIGNFSIAIPQKRAAMLGVVSRPLSALLYCALQTGWAGF
jgi:hypothetical protein